MTSWMVIIVTYLHLGGVISFTMFDWDRREHGEHVGHGETPFNMRGENGGHGDQGGHGGTQFNYDPSSPYGVSRWASLYPQCGVKDESPVNIVTRRVRYGVPFRCPRITYNSNIIAGTLKNNGHTMAFTPKQTEAVKMTNVPYSRGTYILKQFHVHYGGWSMIDGIRSRLMEGSEHEVNGKRYSGEFHFVFYNSRFTGLEQAFDEPGGVTVVSIFAQRMRLGQRLTKEAIQASRFLEKNMPSVSDIDSSVHTTVDLSMFFNRECDFYTYFGSTTTPVCHPKVRWVILRRPISVTHRAWSVFSRIHLNNDFSDHYGNYRPVQPLNGRIIEANFGGLRPISGVIGRKRVLPIIYTDVMAVPYTPFFNALPQTHMDQNSVFNFS